MRLARPFNGFKEYEIKSRPTTDIVIKIYDQSSKGRIFHALHDLLLGCITIDGQEVDSPTIKKMPLVTAEVIAIEIFKDAGYDTKVENIYNCIRCSKQIIHELTRDEDTRDDIRELEIRYSQDEDNYILDLPEGREVLIFAEEGKEAARIYSYKLRDVTLGDFMSISSDHSMNDSVRIGKKINLMCIVDGEAFITDPDLDFQTIKTRYQYELLNFPDIRDFNKIQKLLRSYGLNPRKKIFCPHCGREQDGRVEFTDFFASVLQQSLED